MSLLEEPIDHLEEPTAPLKARLTRRRLLRAFFFLLLLFPLVSLLLHLSVPNAANKLSPRLLPPLEGFASQSPLPELSPATLLSGDFRQGFEDWLSDRLPLRTVFVRLNNQLDFWLFRHAPAQEAAIVIGHGGELYEKHYVREYLGQLRRTARTDIAENLALLEELSAALQARGVRLVLVISPSKASFYPEALPPYFGEKRKDHKRAYDDFVELMDQYQIPIIDGPKLLQEARSAHPLPLFPKGGTHWNLLGAYLVYAPALELLASPPNPPWPFVAPSFSYSLSQKPRGPDRDLKALMNLLFAKGYTVPVMHFASPTTAPFPKKAVLIGTSFSEQLMMILEELPLFPSFHHYNYYDKGIKSCHSCPMDPVDMEKLDWEEEIFNSSAVILEINEMMLKDFGPHNYIRRFARDALEKLGQEEEQEQGLE